MTIAQYQVVSKANVKHILSHTFRTKQASKHAQRIKSRVPCRQMKSKGDVLPSETMHANDPKRRQILMLMTLFDSLKHLP